MVDVFQKAGVDLTPQTGGLSNLAQGKAATASFTTTTPGRAGDRAGERGRRLHDQRPAGHVRAPTSARNPIWGDKGSPNAQDWLQIDLGAPKRFDHGEAVLLLQQGVRRRAAAPTSEPTAYSIQYFDGTNWVDVPSQAKSPAAPAPNYNQVDFPPVTAQLVRVLVTKSTSPARAVGIKEVQVFDTGPRCRRRAAWAGPCRRRCR